MKFLTLPALLVLATNAFASLPQGYAGNYNGKFNGRAGTLVVAERANQLEVRFVSSDGSDDILNENCSSTIGQMSDMDLDQKNGQLIIDTAEFEFDAGTCSSEIEGRKLVVDFKHKNGTPLGIEARIVSRIDETSSMRCHGGANPDCIEVPKTIYQYKVGKFRK